MTAFALLLLVLAVIGTASSAVFLGIGLAGVRKFRAEAAQQQKDASLLSADQLPAVSILKPLHGMEPHLEQNLESFFRQDYPGFEILFAMGHEAFLLQSSMTFVDLHATLQALPHGKIFERG